MREERFGLEALDALIEEANGNPIFETRTKLAVASFEDGIRSVLDKNGVAAEIANVGSTNPDRFTAVLDASRPDLLFPPDVDLYVVTNDKLAEAAVSEICDKLELRGFTTCDHGVPTFKTSLGGMGAEISFVPKSEEQNHAPLQLYRANIPLSDKEIANLKGLSLLLKREGVYGGWHGGIKRIAQEQLIRQFGSLRDTVMYLHRELLSSDPKITVPSPLDLRKNLAASVHPDMWSRLGIDLSEILLRLSGVPGGYNLARWFDEHYQKYFTTVYLVDCNPSHCPHSPREIYQLATRFLQRTALARGETITNQMVFVLPYSNRMEIYISFGDRASPPKDLGLLSQGFYRRFASWYGAHHPKSHIIDPFVALSQSILFAGKK